MKSKKNGELLKTSLDCLTELVKRGNRSLEPALQLVEFQYNDYLGLASLAVSIAALDPDRPDDND